MNLKKYLRLFLINVVALWLISQWLEGASYTGGFKTLATAALVLTIINFFIQPLIKILLLPINLLTLGAFRWLVNVISLYLLTTIVVQFKLEPFHFPGFEYQGFIFPAVDLSRLLVMIVVSFLISFLTTLLLWLVKK